MLISILTYCLILCSLIMAPFLFVVCAAIALCIVAGLGLLAGIAFLGFTTKALPTAFMLLALPAIPMMLVGIGTYLVTTRQRRHASAGLALGQATS